MKYRPDIVIIYDILSALDREGKPISYIVTKSNMPNPRVRERIKIMIENGLVEEFEDKNGRKLYRITDKGVKARSRIKEMILFLREIGLLRYDKIDEELR